MSSGEPGPKMGRDPKNLTCKELLELAAEQRAAPKTADNSPSDPGPGSRSGDSRINLVPPIKNGPIGVFAEALGRALAPHGFFRRQGQVVRVHPETGKLQIVNPQKLRTQAERFVSLYKKRVEDRDVDLMSLVEDFDIAQPYPGDHDDHGDPAETRGDFHGPTSMSRDTAAAVLESDQFLDQLPPLDSVAPVRMPVVRADGTLELLPPGYDAERMIWTDPHGCEFATDMGAEEARGAIDDALSEFRFADARSKAVAVAAMLTVFGKHMLPRGALRPAFVYRANAEGGGKTILAMLAAGACHGKCPVLAPPNTDAEWGNKLFAATRKGSQVLLFDNIEGRLASKALLAYLTSGQFGGRPLGTSDMSDGEAGAVVLITGIRLTMNPDLRRRVLCADLAVEQLRPEDQRYKRILQEPDILAMRPRLLAAMWALVREWDAAGRPPASRNIASFPYWCQGIGGVVEHAGFGCPTVPDQMAGVGDLDMQDLLALMAAMEPGRRYEFPEIVRLCAEGGLFERLVEGADVSGKLSASKRSAFGKLLMGYDGRRTQTGAALRILGKGRARRYALDDGGANGASPPDPGRGS